MADVTIPEPVADARDPITTTTETTSTNSSDETDGLNAPSSTESGSTKVDTASEVVVLKTSPHKPRGIGRFKHLARSIGTPKSRRSMDSLPSLPSSPISEVPPPLIAFPTPTGEKPSVPDLGRKPSLQQKFKLLVQIAGGGGVGSGGDKDTEKCATTTLVAPTPLPAAKTKGFSVIKEEGHGHDTTTLPSSSPPSAPRKSISPPTTPLRSITPSQLAELVDLSMASEAAMHADDDAGANNGPPSPALLPSIEAVLSSSAASSAASVVPSSPTSAVIITPSSSTSTPTAGIPSPSSSATPTTPTPAAASPPTNTSKDTSDDSTPTEPPPDPNTLASEIQSLLRKLPIPPASSTKHECPKPKPPKKDKEGKPIPPSLPAVGDVTISDQLKEYLSSRDVMSGEAQITKGEGEGGGDDGPRDGGDDTGAGGGKTDEGKQLSVWDVLDTLRPPWLEHAPDGGKDGKEGGQQSIMLYVPLDPNDDSGVEVAVAQLIEIPLVTPPSSGSQKGQSQNGDVDTSLPGFVKSSVWPFDGWRKRRTSLPSRPKPTLPAPEKPGKQVPKAPIPPPVKKTKMVKLFVPSTTKLSVEVMWWGYKLYLPPPVLASLTDEANQASKQGALITTALQFLLSHIPMAMVPPSLQPILRLLTTIVPYIGYIGSFLVWSIGEIKAFDKGQGVCLTATWLLPVALIPSALVMPQVVDPPAPPAGGDEGTTPAPTPAPAPVPAPTDPTPTTPVDDHKTTNPAAPPSQPKEGDGKAPSHAGPPPGSTTPAPAPAPAPDAPAPAEPIPTDGKNVTKKADADANVDVAPVPSSPTTTKSGKHKSKWSIGGFRF